MKTLRDYSSKGHVIQYHSSLQVFKFHEGIKEKTGDHSGTVVKVLCYKSEVRWFDPRLCHWNFSLT